MLHLESTLCSKAWCFHPKGTLGSKAWCFHPWARYAGAFISVASWHFKIIAADITNGEVA